MCKILFAGSILMMLVGPLMAQERATNPLTISGYAEAYYVYDFNKPLNNSRPNFVYSHNRDREVSINLALIKAAYNTDNVRANVALATGSYMHTNYAAEAAVLKNVYEANIGFKITKQHNLWIDAGIFSSHLGFESAIGKDNWTLTRSLAADNSPYYEAGAIVSYTSPSGKWFLRALLLNGWQRIQRVDGNTTPAFGHQIVYKPHDRLTINSGSFIGNDKADSVRQMRYFHNLYAVYQISSTLGITAGFDIGIEQKMKGSRDYHIWYTPVMLAKYAVSARFGLTARGEYYRDRQGVIISAADVPGGFNTFGYSLNADYAIFSNLIWRTEYRSLHGREPSFPNKSGKLSTRSPSIATAIAISF
ncbi:porin [Sphingobacterium paludis]|uniref:Putative OmpL-like beta-barrel porin-2 n=1 Tax=Sphingobacterium paludis TaxID=1476465 RepID=A0A4R7CYY4_9SPHI|nr:porin [Sphingobacterium paludis]TDS13147.1 putative OmpL-like beta-barrel porin-2 [Sphingobacterium paludis]